MQWKGPVETGGELRLRLCFDRAGAETGRKINRKIVRGCVGRKQIKSSWRSDIAEHGVEHCLDLENALDDAYQVAPPLLDGFVGQTARIDRQPGPEAVTISFPRIQQKWGGSRQYVCIPDMVDRVLLLRPIVEIDAIDGGRCWLGRIVFWK